MKRAFAAALGGFTTGLLLQAAIGPVFFFVLNVTLRGATADGLMAVLAVSLADYIYIALAILGVGKLLQNERITHAMGIASSAMLLLFGAVMIVGAIGPGNGIPAGPPGPLASFTSAFILTISSPLTILFWTSIFASKAVEKGYGRSELVLFGVAAGLSTIAFLGLSVIVLSLLRASIPPLAAQILNAGVGIVLMAYGGHRIVRVMDSRKRNAREET
jgi:threonine/homoserine/homoserine lactone efflux protein